MTALLVTCLAFLIGSIPSGVFITRALTGRDIREVGSGNIGAANVARSAGYRIGAMVAAIDILKGAVPVLIGMTAGLNRSSLAAVGLAAVLGHDFSIFLKFRGGKGVATTLGVALVLVWPVTILALLVWIITMLAFRYSSVASLFGLAVLPVGSVLTGPRPYAVLMVVLFLLGTAKHWENIVRLLRGTERKFVRTRPANGA